MFVGYIVLGVFLFVWLSFFKGFIDAILIGSLTQVSHILVTLVITDRW